MHSLLNAVPGQGKHIRLVTVHWISLWHALINRFPVTGTYIRRSTFHKVVKLIKGLTEHTGEVKGLQPLLK